MATNFRIKSYQEIREDFLRTYRNGLIAKGITDPDVAPGTEIYLKATAFAQAQSVVYSSLVFQDKQRMPDSAEGVELDRWCTIYGIERQPASASSGFLDFVTAAASVLIPTATELVDPNGQRFAVSSGGTFTTGQRVPIESVSTGTATNLAANVVLRWLSPPANVNSRATVATGGLIGGTDVETDAALSARLQDVIRSKPGSGNWAELNAIAEAADSSVQKSFCYPAFQGPASVLLAVVRAATETNKNRSITDALVLDAVESAATGNLPAWADIQVRTVDDVTCNVSVGLSLSDGQWVDASPWPIKEATGYVPVTTATSSTELTLAADSDPIAGVSHVCWVDPSTWEVKRALVSSFTGAGPYTITLDTPFTGIVAGDFIFPDAVRMDDYVAALLEVFGSLGPGEIADPASYAGLFPRAYRHPLPSQDYANGVGPSILRFLSNTGDEILDVAYLYRQYTAPAYPATLDDNPKILVANRLGFYPNP